MAGTDRWLELDPAWDEPKPDELPQEPNPIFDREDQPPPVRSAPPPPTEVTLEAPDTPLPTDEEERVLAEIRTAYRKLRPEVQQLLALELFARPPAAEPGRSLPPPAEIRPRTVRRRVPWEGHSEAAVLIGAFGLAAVAGVVGWLAGGILWAIGAGFAGWAVGGLGGWVLGRRAKPAKERVRELVQQAQAHSRAGDYPRAVAAYRDALRADLESVLAHTAMARLLAFARDPSVVNFEEAEAHAEKAVKLSGGAKGLPLSTLAAVQNRRGKHAEALATYDRALQADPTSKSAHNGLAWVLATCRTDAVRDGQRAVAHATRACDLSGWKDWTYLDTLAAAYAESCRYDDAIRLMERALPLVPDDRVTDFRERLDLYRAGRPYRESFQGG